MHSAKRLRNAKLTTLTCFELRQAHAKPLTAATEYLFHRESADIHYLHQLTPIELLNLPE